MNYFQSSIRVQAPISRIWQALTVPAEVASWNRDLIRPIDPIDGYPQPDRTVRWRYRLGPFMVILHDQPLVVEHESVLSSYLRLGPFHMVETYRLTNRNGETEVTAEIDLRKKIPLIGPLLLKSTVRDALKSLKKFCES